MELVLESVIAALDNLHLFLVAILSPLLLLQLISDILLVGHMLRSGASSSSEAR